MYFRLFDIHVAVNVVIFMPLPVVLLFIVIVEMYHMYFRLFDIHVNSKCNSTLGLQCLILINKPFIYNLLFAPIIDACSLKRVKLLDKVKNYKK